MTCWDTLYQILRVEKLGRGSKNSITLWTSCKYGPLANNMAYTYYSDFTNSAGAATTAHIEIKQMQSDYSQSLDQSNLQGDKV